MSIFSDVTILNNLNVLGTMTTINSDQINLKDKYIYTNSGYTGTGFSSSGIIFNTNVIVPDLAFDGTITALTSTSITITDTTGLTVGDYIQFSGSADDNNNGLYLVAGITVNTINIDTTAGLQSTSIVNPQDLSGEVNVVSITYLETSEGDIMTANVGSNVSAMTLKTIVSKPSLKLDGAVGGQEAFGGIDAGGLTLIANSNPTFTSVITNGSITGTEAVGSIVSVTDVTGLVPGQQITIAGTASNDETYKVVSISSNDITVNGTIIDGGAGGTVSITGNNSTIVLDGVGNPTNASTTSAVTIQDGAAGLGGLSVEGNVVVRSGALYTPALRGSGVDDADGNTTISLTNTYLNYDLAIQITSTAVTADLGIPSGGSLTLTSLLYRVYLFDHVGGTITITLPNDAPNGTTISFITEGNGGSTSTIETDGVELFDNIAALVSIDLTSPGEKITVIHIGAAWYLM